MLCCTFAVSAHDRCSFSLEDTKIPFMPFLASLNVEEGSVLWLKNAWYDRVWMFVKMAKGWRAVSKTDPLWKKYGGKFTP